MASNNSDNNGGCCGCLVLIVVAIAFCVYRCNNSSDSSKENKQTSSLQYDNSHTPKTSGYIVKEELSDEDKQYANNSLSTGDTPYTEFYGKNYTCPYDQCSGIRVTAPTESDIVVIIKKGDQNGKVIQHGYIRAGGTYQFDVPDGTYQTFFYYGEGWNPNKAMKSGIKGGFVKNEVFSKDNPQSIYSEVLSYVLQLRRDGNFSTKGSNKEEIF